MEEKGRERPPSTLTLGSRQCQPPPSTPTCLTSTRPGDFNPPHVASPSHVFAVDCSKLDCSLFVDWSETSLRLPTSIISSRTTPRPTRPSLPPPSPNPTPPAPFVFIGGLLRNGLLAIRRLVRDVPLPPPRKARLGSGIPPASLELLPPAHHKTLTPLATRCPITPNASLFHRLARPSLGAGTHSA